MNLKNLYLHVLLLLIAFLFAFPLIWTFFTSLKPPNEYYSKPPQLLPINPTLYHYHEAFFPELIDLNYTKKQKYWVEEAAGKANPVTPSLINSIYVTLGSTLLTLILSIPASYALSRYNFKGNKDIAFFLLSTRMVPPIVMIIPFFFIFNYVNLVDTLFGLILMSVMINAPVCIWILKGVFDGIPKEVESAALVDGCNLYYLFTKIILPLSIGGIITASLFCIFFTWTEYIFALIMTRKEAVTLPVALSTFKLDRGLLWGMMSATIIVATIPILGTVYFLQKKIISGILLGSEK
tara:strand:- start:2979 stop:3860 length:882 start_codon:yes stop_codon:yes gene_type:complete